MELSIISYEQANLLYESYAVMDDLSTFLKYGIKKLFAICSGNMILL